MNDQKNKNHITPPQEIHDFRKTALWRIFRIMAEFVEGFNILADLKKGITFFGSARVGPQNFHYKQARKLAYMLGKAGFTIITGGGPGIMEAANHGAQEAGAISVGMNIELPFEQRANKYITKGIGFNYFFTRKVIMAYSAQAYVFFPGGYGTLDEFFELITLIQTNKITRIPIICVDKDFWQPIIESMREILVKKHHMIDEHDLEIPILADNIDEAFRIIKKTKIRRRSY